MTKITTIGLDLVKNTFRVVACNAHGKIVKKNNYLDRRYSPSLPTSLRA